MLMKIVTHSVTFFMFQAVARKFNTVAFGRYANAFFTQKQSILCNFRNINSVACETSLNSFFDYSC